MAYNKKDIIEFIQDSIQNNDGLSPTIVKEIEMAVKGQVEIGNADEYIQGLSEDNHEIKRLLEDVLDGRATVDAEFHVDSSNNVGGVSNIINLTPPKSDEDDGRGTFRDALNEQVRANSNIMIAARAGFGEAATEIKSTLGGKLSQVLGEEKENVIDPMIGIGKGVGKMFGTLGGLQEEGVDMVQESNNALRDMNDVGQLQTSIMDDVSDKLEQTQQTTKDVFDIVEDSNKALKEAYKLDEDHVNIAKNTNAAVDGAYKIEKEHLDISEEAADALKDTYKLDKEKFEFAKREALRGMREKEKKKKDSLLEKMIKRLALTAVVFGSLGAITGAMVIRFTMGIKVFGKLLDTLGIFRNRAAQASNTMSRIGNLFKKIPGVEKMIDFFKSFRRVIDFFKKMRSTIRAMTDMKDLIGLARSLPRMIGSLTVISRSMNTVTRSTMTFARLADNWPRVMETITKIQSGLGRAFRGLRALANTGGFLGKVVTAVSSTVKFLLKTITSTLKFLGRFSFAVNMFKIGFKILGAPLAILLSVIDFFKGFFGSNEATFLGKIKDGLVQVVMGFMDLPMKILGWAYDKVLGLFGVESSGSGQKFSDWFRNITDILLTGLKDFITSPLDFFKNYVKSVTSFLEEKVKGTFLEPIVAVFSFLGDMVTKVMGIVQKSLSKLPGFVGDMFASEEDKAQEAMEEDKARIVEIRIERLAIKERADRGKTGMFGLGGKLDRRKDKKLAEEEKQLSRRLKENSIVVEDIEVGNKQTSLQPISPVMVTSGASAEEMVRQQLVQKGGQYDEPEQSDMDVLQPAPLAIEEPKSEVKPLIEQVKKKDSFIDKSINQLKHTTKTPAGKSNVGFFKGFVDQVKHTTAGSTQVQERRSSLRQSILAASNGGVQKQRDPYKAPQTPHKNTITSITPLRTADNTDQAKAEVMAKQIKATDVVNSSIKQMNKDTKATADRPVVINTGSEGKRIIEPPEDIESMSILFLNKSWGLG